jgi:glycerophosphoryl diester phosphodiesterase
MIKGSRPIVIAHRGNSGPAPACTMAAIRQAVDLGADMIELDVRSSRDGVAVIIHNDTVDETTDGKGPVSSFSVAQLKELDAGSWKDERYAGEQIPTLMEVLEFAKGKVNLSLDLKEDGIIPAMIGDIQAGNMAEDVVICGCYEPQAEKIREIDASLAVLLNVDSQLGKLAKRRDKSEFIREYINRACRGKLAALNVSFKYVTHELIRRAHLRALPVWTWTVDDRSDMRRMLGMGVDAIYTNWPGRLLEVVGRE